MCDKNATHSCVFYTVFVCVFTKVNEVVINILEEGTLSRWKKEIYLGEKRFIHFTKEFN